MYVIFASCRVQPEHLDRFLESMLDDARGSVLDEPGCLRFDVVQDQIDPTRVCLYEIYRDRAAFEAHLQAPHFRRWSETVKDWYAEPMQVHHCASVFLTEDARGAR
jgi:autoinducer 2-degrading protein